MQARKSLLTMYQDISEITMKTCRHVQFHGKGIVVKTLGQVLQRDQEAENAVYWKVRLRIEGL